MTPKRLNGSLAVASVRRSVEPAPLNAFGLRVGVYADGAVLSEMLAEYDRGRVQGFTTNPTLMAKAGVRDYERFARQVLAAIRDLPISFEVFADDFPTMAEQARRLSSWGQNVYVKILDGKARFNGRSSLKTWLFAVIRHTAISQSRRRALGELLTAKWARREIVRVATMPDAAAETSQVCASLVDALRKLARRQREVLELVFYHDMTIEEAAAAMHVSLGSARVHYERGKKQLLAQLNGRLSR